MSSPCRILYVDDNKDSRDLVGAMLGYSNLNYEVTSAESAESAIMLMTSQAFDLFILDYASPEMSGTELCRYIQKSNSNTPILFFTAMARSTDHTEGLAVGANEYLVKPNDLDKFTDTVDRLLNENSATKCKPSVKASETH